MGALIKWDDIVLRYKEAEKARDAKITEASYILPAEGELNGWLCNGFAVPFSLTNITAKDLAIDLAFLKIGVMKIKDRNEFKKCLQERLLRIRNGQECMMVESSNGFIAPIAADTARQSWSDTQDFHPTFGHGEFPCFEVSSDQKRDERFDRGQFNEFGNC